MQKPFSAHRLLTLAALLAALPAVAAPNNITDLGTLKNDNSGRSGASAISGDGSVVVGGSFIIPNSLFGLTDPRATIWSGSGWANKTDLGTLKADNSGSSEANAVSGDGLVVGGWASNDNGEARGIIWSGSNWSTKTDLGTLKADNSGSSFVYALSRDGSVAVGGADDGRVGLMRPIVWSGSNWATKTNLGTLDSSNSLDGTARAVSDDGSIVVGSASDDSVPARAIVWSGSNWATKTDLGTLKTDNSGYSLLEGISADGNFAVGRADNDNGYRRAVVWNLRGGRAVDTANTRAAMSLLSADTASLLAQRARAAENLLGGCRTDGGKFCYSARYRRDIGHGASSRGADFALGYGFTDNFDAAVSLAVPARAEENGSYRLKSGVGIGLSARLHNGAGWYAVPAAAFETDKTRIRRPHLSGTESPENTVRTKGRAYSLTAGRDYGTSGEKTLGWYAALHRTEAERPSYSEDASLSFPFAYGAAKLKETSLAAGIKGRLPLTGKLAWYGNAEVAQRVGGGKARFTASAPFFGKYETERETSRTRPSVQTGVDYAFSPSAVLSLGGYIGRNAFSGTDKGIFLKLNGKF